MNKKKEITKLMNQIDTSIEFQYGLLKRIEVLEKQNKSLFKRLEIAEGWIIKEQRS